VQYLFDYVDSSPE
jgi:hypothetical protein